MNPSNPKNPRKSLTARRLVLLASVAGLGAAALFAGPSGYRLPAWTSSAVAADSTLQHPAGFADIVAKVKPAVISVRVKIPASAEPAMMQQFGDDDEQQIPAQPGSPLDKFMQQFGRQFGQNGQGRQQGAPQSHQTITGEGSGFFISADGYAVTNNHVVDHAKSVQVTTDDGTVYTAKVIGTDARTDLALIKVDGTDFTYVKLADGAPRVGDWVLAVGNPFGLGGTVTAGIVSARGRDIGAGPYDDFIQIDAPVNKGNSGGPTFDVEGNVIGVNTAIFSPSGGSVGIAFAIPSDTVKNVVTQLREKGSVTRGWIGVQIQQVTPDLADSLGLKKTAGALVSEPQPNSPAAKAGIESGDVITSVDGTSVADARELARRIGTMAPGTTVKLGLIHQGQEKTVTLTLGTLPSERQAANQQNQRETPDNDVPKLGLTLAPGSKVAGADGNGVVVTAVDPDGVAADHGFQVGDVILDVGGKSVASPGDVRKELADARKQGKHTLLFRVKSGEGTHFVALPLGNA